MSLTITSLDGVALIEDGGRPGLAAEGISACGAWDRRSFRLANAVLGNDATAATVEILLGNICLCAESDTDLAIVGPPLRVNIAVHGNHRRKPRFGYKPLAGDGLQANDRLQPGDVPQPGDDAQPSDELQLSDEFPAGDDPQSRDQLQSAVRLAIPSGARVTISAPAWGARAYLALAGGVAAKKILGSLSTDTLGKLGPQVLRVGSTVTPTLADHAKPATTIDIESRAWPGKPYIFDLLPGPHLDWFTPAARRALFGGTYRVTPQADRVGIRLEGESLNRTRASELAPQPMVRGALQVPPSGQPLIFGPDHPTTGGYPVVAVLTESSADASAQLRSGDEIRFRRVGKWPELPLR